MQGASALCLPLLRRGHERRGFRALDMYPGLRACTVRPSRLHLVCCAF